ncbi:zinc-binding metallopeptidase [Sphingobacterium paludis]|uniref:Substrate import-associated zinc metallohydrolase lipoprotein n=1 Tax=Sphingobacterium paludis TaxID=1476465 RepID=A0A4R7CSS9_9SPHI|nr:putative zinc-binding metallopeptidase [Sphingobacterium paludis]TDS08912.1 substrate import-associated zinc metallohydrolase lipoprotein [Sphingobacterium paludis]
MKRRLNFTLLLSLFLVFSCSEQDLDPKSVLIDGNIEQNELDSYIERQFTKDYNIAVVYKFVEAESDLDYNLSPATYESSVRMTKLLHYLGVEPYDKITGSKMFIRSYFPKLLNYIGSPAYKNNGTFVLGTAEGGTKITMYALNSLNANTGKDVEFLNSFYFHTIHHEFAHILHQTKDYPSSFDQITGSGYVGDSWSDIYNDISALEEGFISSYASKEANEDFVETYSFYITLSPEAWDQRLRDAGTVGKNKIDAKLDIVRNYFKNAWNIDLDQLREEILARQADLSKFDQLSLN